MPEALHWLGHAPSTPCGGKGPCSKCRVTVNDQEVLSCQMQVDQDMTITLPQDERPNILSSESGISADVDPEVTGNLIAIDPGTTTMVCYLLDPSGRELAVSSALNPQGIYGADVISRIHAALDGELEDWITPPSASSKDTARRKCLRQWCKAPGSQRNLSDRLANEIEFLELAALPEFQHTFRKHTFYLKETSL